MPNTRGRKNRSQNRIEGNNDDTITRIINRGPVTSTPNITTPQFIVPDGYMLVPINNENGIQNGNRDGIVANNRQDDIEINETSTQSKVNVQVFKGSNDKITIENFFKRFELISNNSKWSNNKKILMLGNFFEDEALNHYLEICDINDWNEIKNNLISRFSLGTCNPMNDFVELRYDFKTGLKDYFERKKQLGVLAKLTEQQIIPIMINGLHPKFRMHFVTVQPQTYAEFYRIAKAIEDNLNENYKSHKQKPHANNNQNKKPNDSTKNKRKPPSACRICEGLGFKNRFHWASDCKNKNKNSNSYTNTNPNLNSKQINITDKQETESIANYPILENITLN